VPRFLLLLSPEHRAGGELCAAELGARTARFVAWVEELRRRGSLREGARLDRCAGRVLRERDGARVAGNARHAAAEIGLYFVVEAPDWDAALALAARCPGADPGTIDVYRLDPRALHLPSP
jgi:hypothetical protein